MVNTITKKEKVERPSDKKDPKIDIPIKTKRGLSICIISRGTLPTIWMSHMMERVSKFIPSGMYWNTLFMIGSPETNGKNYAMLRNDCVKEAIRRGSKWILFVDDDVFLPEFAIQKFLKLSQQGLKVISGVYYKKSEKVEPVIFKELGNGPYFEFPINSVFEIEGSGAGCLWIDLDIFKKFDEAGLPYFKQDWTMALDDNEKNLVQVEIGEDHWLYYQAKRLGFQPYCDSSILCDHYDSRNNKMYPVDSEVARIKGIDFRSRPEYKDMIKVMEMPKKPNLVFISPSSMPFNGDDIEKKPLGGSETTLIHTAKRLAKDYNVAVFCRETKPDIHDGVMYLDITAIDVLDTIPIDIAVMYRTTDSNYIAEAKKKIKPKKFIFWTQDYPMYAGFNDSFPKTAELFDATICVSNDHKEALMARYPALLDEDKIFVIENGVDKELYKDRKIVKKNKNQFYYSSTPFRGLEVLLELFPKIKAKVPDATLKVCSSMHVYGDALADKQYEHLYKKCRELDGVQYMGSMKQKDLAQIAMESYLHLYPSTFAETNCISVEEAQTAGTPVICNNLGAIKETVHGGCGVIIKGNAKKEKWQEQFIDTVIAQCTEGTKNCPNAWEDMHKNCLKQNFDWSLSVEKWKKLLSQCTGGQSTKVEKP